MDISEVTDRGIFYFFILVFFFFTLSNSIDVAKDVSHKSILNNNNNPSIVNMNGQQFELQQRQHSGSISLRQSD